MSVTTDPSYGVIVLLHLSYGVPYRIDEITEPGGDVAEVGGIEGLEVKTGDRHLTL